MDRAFLLCVLALSSAARAADLSTSLLTAAADGKTAEVQTLLEKGAPVDARDKKDRTPLMLAAQHGRAETVRLLLAKGAHADARDRMGYTAYALAIFAPAGRGNHEEALKALPPTPPIRIAVTSEVNPGRIKSSCFMTKAELPREIARLHLEAVMREEFLAFAAASGKGLLEILPADPGPADALVALTILPSVACTGENDNLSVSVDVRVFRPATHELLFEKSFGGGIKGMKVQPVNNPAQYAPVLQSWLRPQAAPIYWAVAESLYRTPQTK